MSKTKSLLGLSEMESAVYRAALEMGEATMQDLARKSGVKRTSIYNFIEKLKAEGFISMTRRKKHTLYSAIHPRHVLEIQKQRLGQLEQILPELTAIYNKSATKPRVTFYEGIEGIKEVYADTLREQRPIIAWSDFDYLLSTLGEEYCEQYPSERARRHIPFRAITRDSGASRKIASMNEKYLRKTKFIKSNDLKTEINIYGDKVAMMSLRSNPPYAILIENHDIAETLRVAWEELWNKLS